VSIRCEQEGGGDEEEKEWETKLEKGTPTAMVGRKKEGRVGDGGERHDLRALLVVVEALYLVLTPLIFLHTFCIAVLSPRILFALHQNKSIGKHTRSSFAFRSACVYVAWL